MTAMMTNKILSTDNYIVTGSSVLGLRYIKDIDVICYLDDILIDTDGDEYIRTAFVDGIKYEFLLADNQSSLQWLLINKDELTPEEIYLILKRGHLHIAGKRQENWEKHMLDYNILKKMVNEGNGDVQYGIKLHKHSTDERIKQRTPRLNGVSKEKFFDDNVVKYIDHDLIHEAVAYDRVPAYTKMQREDGTVTCHKDLWNKMSYDEQLQSVAEEAMVIAIERHILPFKIDGKLTKPPFMAFKWALWRICTTLCSGWFREFAIDNYYHVLNMYDEQRINNVVETLNIKQQ